MTNSEWDHLSTHFNTHQEEISADAADNVLIAWPPIVKIIHSYFKQIKKQNAVDLGCGGGGFCKKLHQMGFTVTGIDPSKGMIEVARKNNDQDIEFIVGDSSDLLKLKNIELLTSVMALQFVKEIEETINHISNSLTKDGLVVICVFNPRYVSACLQAGVLFKNFDNIDKPKEGIIVLAYQEIPTYIRSFDEYDQLFEKFGFTSIAKVEPPFTTEFLAKYPQEVSSEPEYLVLGFVKE